MEENREDIKVASILWHDSNNIHREEIACLSWEASGDKHSVMVYDGENTHIVPMNGSIIDIGLPADKEHALIHTRCGWEEQTVKQEIGFNDMLKASGIGK